MDKKLAFIGCGNIASAMIRGVVGSGVVAAENVMAADPCGERPQKLAQELGIRPETNNRKAVDLSLIHI